MKQHGIGELSRALWVVTYLPPSTARRFHLKVTRKPDQLQPFRRVVTEESALKPAFDSGDDGKYREDLNIDKQKVCE